MKILKTILVGGIILAVIIAGVFYTCGDEINLLVKGYTVNWDEPWIIDGVKRYYTRRKCSDNKVYGTYMTEWEIETMIYTMRNGGEIEVP